MSFLTDTLGHLPPAAAYAVLALVVCAESILLLGAFAPTLTLLLTAGALARTGHIGLILVIAVAATAAVAGDFLAHRTGTLLGGRLREGRIGRRIPAAGWRHAETLMNRHGGRALFLSRFLPLIRTLTPHFAGAIRMPYRRIALYSVTAACLWATIEAGIGYAAAASLQRILAFGGPALAAVTATAVIVAGVTVWARKHRRPTVIPTTGSEERLDGLHREVRSDVLDPGDGHHPPAEEGLVRGEVRDRHAREIVGAAK